MIPYGGGGFFGFSILFRVHGSAVYKAMTPAVISAGVYTALFFGASENLWDAPLFEHPYPMTALVTAFTFLLVFRANYSYNRWWEAYSCVYLMHSKWLDLATDVAAFHYQSYRYQDSKPPSFGSHPKISSVLLKDTDIMRGGGEDAVEPEGSKRTKDAIEDHDDNSNLSTLQDQNSAASRRPAQREKDDPEGDDSQSLVSVITPPMLSRGVSRQRHRTQRNHQRHLTVENLLEQMNAHEQAEKELQEQLDELQREEEDRIRQDLERREQQEKDERLANEIENINPMDASTNNNNIALQTKKRMNPLSSIKGRFQSFRQKRRQHHQDHRHSSFSVTNADNKNRAQRPSRFAFGNTPPVDMHGLTMHASTDSTQAEAAATAAAVQTRRSKSINRTALVTTTASHPRRRRRVVPNNYHQDILFKDRFDTTTGKPYSIFTAVTRTQLRAGHIDPDAVPPLLFLEECAHLLSLLSAVAFSTLRNDLPYAESPLTYFEPGLPWPHVDPDAYKRKNRKGWEGSSYRWITLMRFVMGASRTERDRMLYNVARPFRVIGNVSDNEIQQLQQARGPLAKVSLVSMWLQELISREHSTSDSTGEIAPPIIARLYQLVSEGLAGYNQARKISSIPFPFAHAQLTTLFLGVVDFIIIPVLMLSFVNEPWLGFALNVSTVLCFTGLHEVAREIESPFTNVPNDVPLNNFQAQFNEGLIVMFYGYHPDAYWDVEETMQDVQKKEKETKHKKQNSTRTIPSLSETADQLKVSQLSNLMTKEESSASSISDSNASNSAPNTKAIPSSKDLGFDSSSISFFTNSSAPSRRRKPANITVTDENLMDEEPPSIEAIMASQSGSWLSMDEQEMSYSPLKRSDESAVATPTVEKEQEEYVPMFGGNTQTLSSEQLEMKQATERQHRLDQARLPVDQREPLKVRQEEVIERQSFIAAASSGAAGSKRFGHKLSSSFSSSSSNRSAARQAQHRPQQVSFLVPDGEDSSLVFFLEEEEENDNGGGYNDADHEVEHA